MFGLSGGIYLVQDEGDLVRLDEQPYEAEVVLQRLLAEHPALLAGEQIDPTAPRRWLLVSQEAAVPSEEGGAGRWAIDHLFLDQDAVPTIVEVKRSSDTRVRREVVGQMLDYAANAVVYWPVESIRAQFEAHRLEMGEDPVEVVAGFVDDGDPDRFWQSAKTNLQTGRIRLVFVADVIPPELRRVVEFLNTQMDPAEVIAVEVRQFVGQGIKALVPQVVGQSAAAQQAKTTTRPAARQWDRASFLDALAAKRGAAEADVARDILGWAERTGLRIWWGKGGQDGSFFPLLDHAGGVHWTFSVWTYGRVEIQFKQLARQHADAEHQPFASEQARVELLDRLNSVPGVDIPLSAIARRPSFPLAALVDLAARRQFLAVMDWLVESLKEPRPSDAL